jgi:hypothetical protein
MDSVAYFPPCSLCIAGSVRNSHPERAPGTFALKVERNELYEIPFDLIVFVSGIFCDASPCHSVRFVFVGSSVRHERYFHLMLNGLIRVWT